MTDLTTPPPDDINDETMERLMAKHSEPTPEVLDAMAELELARTGMTAALDDLTSASQSALDVPAKIKRNPVKTAALLGGTGFLIAGGPRRVVRFVGRRIFPQRPDRHAGILPPDVERILKDAGVAKDPEVRRALNRDFADYLKNKGEYGPEPSPSRSFWRTFDRLAGPLGTAGARVMVQRLMEAEHDRAAARGDARDRAEAKRAKDEEARKAKE